MGGGDQSRGRVDRQGGTHGQEKVATACGFFATDEVVDHQVLTEADGGRLEDPRADTSRCRRRAGRILFAPPDAVQDVGHGCAGTTGEAGDEAHGPVDLDHLVGVVPRRLVQPVDVLGDQRVEGAEPFQGDECLVPGVGQRRPCRRVEAVPPGPAADIGVGHIDVESRELLRFRVFRPDSRRAAEVGDPRVGGDPGPREDDDPPAGADDGPGPVHGVLDLHRQSVA